MNAFWPFETSHEFWTAVFAMLVLLTGIAIVLIATLRRHKKKYREKPKIKSPFVDDGFAYIGMSWADLKLDDSFMRVPLLYYTCAETGQQFTTEEVENLNWKIVQLWKRDHDELTDKEHVEYE